MGEYVIEPHYGCDRRIAELEAEIERLRAAIERHRQDCQESEGSEALLVGADHRLWALLADEGSDQ
jgi:hypothetical protein